MAQPTHGRRYRLLPLDRPARTVQVGDQLRTLDGTWRTVAAINDIGPPSRYRQFIFDDGEDYWARENRAVRHRRNTDIDG